MSDYDLLYETPETGQLSIDDSGKAKRTFASSEDDGMPSLSGKPKYPTGIGGSTVPTGPARPPERSQRAPSPEELMMMANKMENDLMVSRGHQMAQGPAARRLAQGSAETGYNTELTQGGEKAYLDWKQKYDPLDSGVDYDHRGFFNANETRGANGHGTDKFKKPNHPTFSNESQYATGDNAQFAGSWGPGEENYLPPSVSYNPPDWLNQYMDDQVDPMTGPLDTTGGRKYLQEQDALRQYKIDSGR